MMINNGVELSEIQKYLRHKSIQSTEVYAKVWDTKYRQAMENFWGDFNINI
jgi:site-specific recombinase XerD